MRPQFEDLRIFDSYLAFLRRVGLDPNIFNQNCSVASEHFFTLSGPSSPPPYTRGSCDSIRFQAIPYASDNLAPVYGSASVCSFITAAYKHERRPPHLNPLMQCKLARKRHSIAIRKLGPGMANPGYPSQRRCFVVRRVPGYPWIVRRSPATHPVFSKSWSKLRVCFFVPAAVGWVNRNLRSCARAHVKDIDIIRVFAF